MADWTLKSGWFLINYGVILDGGVELCYCGNILLCMKRNERKSRMQQWRLLLCTSANGGSNPSRDKYVLTLKPGIPVLE